MVQFPKVVWFFLSAIPVWLSLFSTVFGVQLSNSGGQQASLEWGASPDPSVVGYYIYYGTTSGYYTNKINAGTNLSYTATELTAGQTYYFTATSYNGAGMESGYVPEVSYIVPGILTLTPNPTNNLMQIRFPVSSSNFYQLQQSLDLKSWTNIWVTPIQTTNIWIEYDEPKTNAAMFYRLILN